MLPIQITMRSIESTAAIENHIHKHFRKLKHAYHSLVNCKVVIDVVQNHKPKLFSVHINMNLPGKKLLTCQKHHEDLYLAIRNSFNAMEKLLAKHWSRKILYLDKYTRCSMIDKDTSSLSSVS